MTTEKNSAPILKLGDTIDGYHVLQVIGKGNMGDVYLAKQLNLDRLVAIKTMKPRLAGDKEFLERFYREAQAAGRITHPNIVRVYDVGCDKEKGIHYIAMEFVDGETVWERLKREKVIPVVEAAAIGIEVLKALAHAHRQGIVHRDIKPDNMLVDRQGNIKVSDFGLAVQIEGAALEGTRAKTVIGTLAYLPPELWRGGKVDGRADIFSLGASLYHMITGQRPFPGGSNEEIFEKMKRWDLKPPYVVNADVPKPMSDVVMKMMAPDPDDRFPDCAAAMHALSEALAKCVFDRTTRLVSLPPSAAAPAPAAAPPLKLPIEEGAVLVDDHAERAALARKEEKVQPEKRPPAASARAPSLRERLGLSEKPPRRAPQSAEPEGPAQAATPQEPSPLASGIQAGLKESPQMSQPNLDPVYRPVEPEAAGRRRAEEQSQPLPPCDAPDAMELLRPAARLRKNEERFGARATEPAPSTRELIVCGILLFLAVVIFLIAVAVQISRMRGPKIKTYEPLPGTPRKSSLISSPSWADAIRDAPAGGLPRSG